MRSTSLEVYNQIKDEGLLSKLRMQVYSYIFKNGPCTAKQVAKGVSGGYRMAGTISSRFSELERLGVIAVSGHTVCPESKRTVMVWDVTENLPKNHEEYELSRINKKIRYHERCIIALNNKKKRMLSKTQEQLGLFNEP